MINKCLILLTLVAISLISCSKAAEIRKESDWDDLPPDGYYEWIGNVHPGGTLDSPVQKVEVIWTPEEAGCSAAIKIVSLPKSLARIEFVYNGEIIRTANIGRIRDEYGVYTEIFDQEGKIICRTDRYWSVEKSPFVGDYFVARSIGGNLFSTFYSHGLPYFQRKH